MKNVLILLADGAEECEALVTRDVLLRAGLNVVTQSINERNEVLSQNKFLIKCDTSFDVDLNEFDAIVLPGGGRGTMNLDNYEKMDHILDHFFKKHKVVAAICAAPMVLGHRGCLKNKHFTCFSGCEEGLDGFYTGKEVEMDDNIITARSMYYASEFALKIVSKLLGEETSNKVSRSIKNLK